MCVCIDIYTCVCVCVRQSVRAGLQSAGTGANCGKVEDLADFLGLFQMLDFPGLFPGPDTHPVTASGQGCRHWKYQACRCRDTGISLVRGLSVTRSVFNI